MNATFLLKQLLVAIAALPLILAANSGDPGYQAANVRISADYTRDKAACLELDSGRGRACLEQARSRKQEARAELESGQAGKGVDQRGLREASSSGVSHQRDANLKPVAAPSKSSTLQ